MNLILSIALLFLLGFGAKKVFQRMRFPMVTAYLILGILIGPYGLNLIHIRILNASGVFSEIVLGMIAFSIGKNFSFINLKRIGKSVLIISIFEVILACGLVTLLFHFIFHKPLHTTILFGAIAAATAPAATIAVVREYNAKGSLTSTLLGVVAIDDAWGLILFSAAFAFSRTLYLGGEIFIHKVFGLALLEIFGAVLLGLGIGWILSILSFMAKTKGEILIYTLGFILLGVGIARFLNLSVLLTGMSLGVATVNLKPRDRRFFEAIESIDPILFLIFFSLVGAELKIPTLVYLGTLGVAYLVARVVGKFLGAYIGGQVVHAEDKIKRWLGLGLVPQAGVALGMALYVDSYLPEIGDIVLPVIIGSTILYELVGPVCTKFALSQAGEIGG